MSESLLRYLPLASLPVVLFVAVVLGLQVKTLRAEMVVLSTEVEALQGHVVRMQKTVTGQVARVATPRPSQRRGAKAGKGRKAQRDGEGRAKRAAPPRDGKAAKAKGSKARGAKAGRVRRAPPGGGAPTPDGGQ